MRNLPRLLAAALLLSTSGLVAPSAFAQDEAGGEAADPMSGFTMPEPPPVHDYTSGPDEQGFASMEARVSYAIGVNIGTGLSREFEQMGATLDGEQLAEGLEKAVSGSDTKLDEMQVGQTLQSFQQQMMEQQMAAAEAKAGANKEAAAAFFEGHKGEEGVTTTDSGLQYKLDTRGDGAVPTEGQVVKLNYRGTLLDGTEFDSSYDSPEPAEFPVGAVIPGFNEALLLMPVGSKGTIWIPSDLAYGDTPPRGSVIEPGSALIFDLEILSVADEAPFPSADVEQLGADMQAVEGDLQQIEGDASDAAASGEEQAGMSGDREKEPEMKAVHRDVLAD